MAELSPVVLQRHVDHEFEGVRFSQDEDFFRVRCPAFDLDVSRWTATERRVIEEHRWWTREELARPQEKVFPADLGAVRETLDGW